MTDEQETAGIEAKKYEAFIHPFTRSELHRVEMGMHCEDGMIFPSLYKNVFDFISPFSTTEYDKSNLEMYNAPASTEIYRNFLDWLFSTFGEDEIKFRERLIKYLNLSVGHKVLLTSVGLGDDIPLIQKYIGANGVLHAQDISKEMVLLAAKKNEGSNLMFSISNGNALPYADDYFDAVFHFGGINLFGDTKKAITEMSRVCKVNGRVVFGDEGIASHLRETEYAKIAINNNKLWDAKTPLDLLPHCANEIQLNCILGNCFYVISFTKGDGFPFMNIDIKHKGLRGGTARTRYYGQIEGVTEDTKNKLIDKAKILNTSVHSLLEKIINDAIK